MPRKVANKAALTHSQRLFPLVCSGFSRLLRALRRAFFALFSFFAREVGVPRHSTHLHSVSSSSLRYSSQSGVVQAAASFNADNAPLAVLESAGVPMRQVGSEWHSVDGCPLPGCPSVNDAFRVHPCRSPKDSHGPQWACRRCGRGGDALRLAMLLASSNPGEPGAVTRFLRDRGYVATSHLDGKKMGSRSVELPNVTANRRSVQSTHARTDTALPASGQVPFRQPEGPADALRWFRGDVPRKLGRRPTDDELEALEERAAILEYDAGFSREVAEHRALLDLTKGGTLWARK